MSVHSSAGRLSQWFLFPERAEAPVALYCLPHSGAGATAYRSWVTSAPPELSVRPLQLPGRESRINEPPEVEVADVADVLAAETRPYALYGHSFGALLGHAAVAELQRRGAPLPERLFVGASRPPDATSGFARSVLRLGDDEFLRQVVTMGGTPAEILEHPALAALLVPVLRADFGWIERYESGPHALLDVPIVGFAGAQDVLASAEAMAGWRRLTTRSYRGRTMPGAHFFHTAPGSGLLPVIAADLAGEPG
ncbi:alpha/beta fold hydrolase [Actinoplanes sp. NPDC023936]|uniref:thioesterase II family protein n=1 Tax=Actinoplanes sp. NPDC023936 TaxID=3154910 RepID=UPI0033CB2CF8